MDKINEQFTEDLEHWAFGEYVVDDCLLETGFEVPEGPEDSIPVLKYEDLT